MTDFIIPSISNDDLYWMRRILRAYYARHGRSLPWREITNPYLILNTEIMLQRTKAEDVAAHWTAMKARLGSPETALHGMNYLRGLLKRLGLAKRADWIASIARLVLKGGVPNSLERLLELPGVGNYSARATLAFAFGQNEGLVDANIIRTFERFWGPYPHHDPRHKIRFWLPVSELLGGKRDFRKVFWGLLDLASQICKPRNPDCPNCPLNRRCKTGMKLPGVLPRSSA